MAGPNGDLIIVITVQENQMFQRNNNDLITSLKVKPSELICGIKKEIKIFNDTITFEIPAMYDMFKPFIIPNKGFMNYQTNQKGNIIIYLGLLLPEQQLSEENKQKLLEIEQTIY